MTDTSEPYNGDPPFVAGSETSEQAAAEIVDSRATLCERVYAYLVRCAELGATDDEIQYALKMNGSTQRPRRIELEAAGRVQKTDRTRKTASGRHAAVYVAVRPRVALMQGELL